MTVLGILKFENPSLIVQVIFLLIKTGRINEQKAVGLLRESKCRGLVELFTFAKT